jgi:hypothetical protein
MLFDRPQDPLKEYLRQRASQNSSNQIVAPDSPQSPKISTIWTFLDRHYEMLHKVWIYGIAFAVTCSVINPLTGWKEFAAVPIVTVFMGAVVAIAELPLTMMLVLLVSVVRVVVERLRRRKQP